MEVALQSSSQLMISDQSRHPIRMGAVQDLGDKNVARRIIINHWETWYGENKTRFDRKSNALTSYCMLYNERKLDINESIYSRIKTTSRATVQRWAKDIVVSEPKSISVKINLNQILIPFKTSLNEPQIIFILGKYLDEGQMKVLTIYKYMKMTDLGKGVTYRMVHHFIKRFDEYNRHIVVLAREGKSAFRNKIAPHIIRDWNAIDPDDLWVADGHKLDFHVRTGNGKKARPVAVMFMDAKSRYITGCSLHYTETTISVAQALAHGLMFSGTPKYVLFDNGSSFKNDRMLGEVIDGVRVGGLLEKLRIEPIWSIPGNPQSKHIERNFLTVKDDFSRPIISFSGGSPDTRPERSEFVKADDCPDLYTAYTLLLGYIHFFNNQPHSALGGKTPYEVYQPEIRKHWDPRELNGFMRPVCRRKVMSNGIRITRNGKAIWYYNREWVPRLVGNGVTYLIKSHDYDTESIDVHENDKHEKYLFTATRKEEIHPVVRDADPAFKEMISNEMATKRQIEKGGREAISEIHEKDTQPILEILSSQPVPLIEKKVDMNFELDEDRTGILPEERESIGTLKEKNEATRSLLGLD